MRKKDSQSNTHGDTFRPVLISWLGIAAFLFWFKGGAMPLVVAVSGAGVLWALSRYTPNLFGKIALLSPLRLALLAFTGVVCAVIGEFVITKVAPQPQVYGWLSRDTYEIHPTRWFARKPNLDIELSVPDYTYRLQTNSLGFRDKEHAVEKAAGVTRVLLIGDSFTDGDGVPLRDNYPSVMERALNASSAGDEESVPDWEIINVSVPGYGPIETGLTLDEFGSRYKPDLIIYGFYLGNDLADAMKSRDEKLHEIGLLKDDVSLFPLNNWLWRNSNFYVLIQNALSALNERRAGGATGRQLGLTGVRYFRKDAPEKFKRGWDNTVVSLVRMKQVADSVGADLLVALFPVPSVVTPSGLLEYVPTGLNIFDTSRYDANWLQRSAHSKLDSLQLTYVDLTSAYRESKIQPLFNTLADHHPNRDGYRLMGEFIASEAQRWRITAKKAE
jgi:hypothetical protein